MIRKYKFVNAGGIYFITATVVEWVDVFTRNIYRDILLDSFKFCQQHQGSQVYAWVLMQNHFHMICSFDNNDPVLVLKNIKSFTVMKLIDAITNNPKESKKQWMLDIFEKQGSLNKGNYRFQFWQPENHPIQLDNYSDNYKQGLPYLHENPVRAGFVWQPQDWKYSSATDFYTTQKGLLDLSIV